MGRRVSLVIPWRGDGGQRDINLEYVLSVYRTVIPHAEVLFSDTGAHPFSRAGSRNAGVHQAGGELVVVSDADVVVQPDAVHAALHHAAQDGRIHLPYTTIYALNARGTAAYMHADAPQFEHIWYAHEAAMGGVYVCRREQWVNQDERYVGWGFEDTAYADMLQRQGHGLVKHPGHIVHLWHTPESDPRSAQYRRNQRLYARQAGKGGG